MGVGGTHTRKLADNFLGVLLILGKIHSWFAYIIHTPPLILKSISNTGNCLSLRSVHVKSVYKVESGEAETLLAWLYCQSRFVVPGCSTDSLLSREASQIWSSILPAFPGHRDPPSAPESALLLDQVAIASSPHKAQPLPAGRSIYPLNFLKSYIQTWDFDHILKHKWEKSAL